MEVWPLCVLFFLACSRTDGAMLKKLWRRLFLLVGVLVVCSGVRDAAGAVRSWWLVSPELLKHAKLEMVWQTELPLKKGDSIRELRILGERIYMLSDGNHIVSMDRGNGNVIFSRSLAQAGFPVVGLELYEDELFTVVANELVEINPEFGTVLGTRRLGFGVACPAARNSLCFYVSGTDRRIHTYRALDKVGLFQVAADNDSTITSIIADDNFVVFGTEAGNVVSITAGGPMRLWQFDAGGGIAGEVVRDGQSLFFASKDTNVYRVDMIDGLGGEFVWKYQTAAVLDRAPRVGEKVVYQHVLYKGFEAIDKASGEFMWQVPGGVELLAESGGKAYVIANGMLVVMDNIKKRRLYSVNFEGVSRYAVNTADSRIYIADKSGRIGCIKPVE